MARTARRYRRELKSEINVVPLIDVLLVLLLVFMATTPINVQSVEVELPNSDNSKIMSNTNNVPIIIEVSDTGQYTLVINHQRMALRSQEQLEAQVKSRLVANPKAVFLIGGAKDVPYDEIIKVLSVLHQAHVTSVGLITHPI